MNAKLVKLLLCLFTVSLIAACGSKGPLYQTPEQPQPANENSSAKDG